MCTRSGRNQTGWRQRIPAAWLFTDERLGGQSPDDPLWAAIAALPVGGGIIFRHYSWAPGPRLHLLEAIRQQARRRRLCLVVSRMVMAPAQIDGIHLPEGTRPPLNAAHRLITASAHSQPALRRAFALGADLVFLSPVFPTRSHPGETVLGPLRFGLFARGAPGPVLALGGMDAVRARILGRLGASGFGGIDCWARRAQKSTPADKAGLALGAQAL